MIYKFILYVSSFAIVSGIDFIVIYRKINKECLFSLILAIINFYLYWKIV